MLKQTLISILTNAAQPLDLKTIYEEVRKARPGTKDSSIRSELNKGAPAGVFKRVGRGKYTIEAGQKTAENGKEIEDKHDRFNSATAATAELLASIGVLGYLVLHHLSFKPLTAGEISEKLKDVRKGDATLERLLSLKLVERRENVFSVTARGGYIASVFSAVHEDLQVVDGRGKDGLRAITIEHAKIARELARKRADIKDVLERMRKSVELGKKNWEDLLMLLPA